MNQCWFLRMICPATSFATELNPVILLGLSFQPSAEKRKYIINIPEAHQEICKVRSSCPSKLLSSGTEGSDEHEAEPGLALHEPFQIWKKLYCYLSFIQNMLAPLTWIRNYYIMLPDHVLSAFHATKSSVTSHMLSGATIVLKNNLHMYTVKWQLKILLFHPNCVIVPCLQFVLSLHSVQ